MNVGDLKDDACSLYDLSKWDQTKELGKIGEMQAYKKIASPRPTITGTVGGHTHSRQQQREYNWTRSKLASLQSTK